VQNTPCSRLHAPIKFCYNVVTGANALPYRPKGITVLCPTSTQHGITSTIRPPSRPSRTSPTCLGIQAIGRYPFVRSYVTKGPPTWRLMGHWVMGCGSLPSSEETTTGTSRSELRRTTSLAALRQVSGSGSTPCTTMPDLEYFDARARQLSILTLQKEAEHGCYDPGEGGCMPNCKSCAARAELKRRKVPQHDPQ
jgi:hypothetical protein